MKKSMAIRIGGFAAALCASGALIGTAVSGTGAYFTDAHDGSITASSGHLKLNVTNPHLTFANLMPGTDSEQDINYSADTNGPEDVWMVFDTSSAAYGAFSGAAGSDQPYPSGGLGRYGHFAVSANHNLAFRSWNLAGRPTGDTDTNDACGVNAYGQGGSDDAATPTHTPKYCPVPGAILLASNVNNGDTGQIEVTFGVTGKWTAQNSPVANVPFQVVATQHGIAPDDPWNP